MRSTMEVSLENVTKKFGAVIALRDVTLRVRAGERVVFLGPSGSGKTTLLRLIAGLENPSSGWIAIGQRRNADARQLANDVAMVFQNLALFPHLTARENIVLGLKVRRLPHEQIEARVAEVAQMLSIGALLRRRPHELSAGERQRVGLARALAKRPAVLLLDEAFANLDAHLRAELRVELKRLHGAYGMTMICVTHDLLEAITLGERIAVLNAGTLEQFDTPSRLLDEPESAFVKKFMRLPEIPELARRLVAPVEAPL
jgi:multiple sugar transport system ATP-binding protein